VNPADLNEIRDMLVAHREMIKRACEIISAFPWRGNSVWDADEDGAPVLVVESDGVATLIWRKVGYEGGSWLEDVHFPADLLLLGADDLQARRDQAQREWEVRRVRAQEAANADARRRQEAQDRREYARLAKKYGAPK
jgi:hypothetical protein